MTPGKASSPTLSPTASLSAAVDTTGKNGSQPPRRSSLGFLRRSKSGEPPARLSKKERVAREQEILRQQELLNAVPKAPPRLPDIYNGAPPPAINSFGGDGSSSDGVNGTGGSNSNRHHAIYGPTVVPIPPIPFKPIDPYARTESMTNRGRYSYASSAISTINSPRRVRRRKDPTPFK
jgi:hypothetical protein